MQLNNFQESYPGGLQAGALEEIRERCAAMAAAAAAPVPDGGRPTRTAAKRAAEPPTVLRTVRARRGPTALPQFGEVQAASGLPLAEKAAFTGKRRVQSCTAAPQDVPVELAAGSQDTAAAAVLSHRAGGQSAFRGKPLQTPMPFMGEAVALPITVVTQKHGGRTKAAPVPEAAIITTADGKQWALGSEGINAIPDTHRQEVSDLLTAQFNFFAAALGKTVFQRGGRRR